MANLKDRRQHAVTPYRETTVILDYGATERSWSEPPFSQTRRKHEMHPDLAASYGVQQLSSGAVIMKPINDEEWKASTLLWTGALQLASWKASTGIEEVPRWRNPTDITGVTSGQSASVLASGDYWMVRRPTAATDLSTLELPITLPKVPIDLQPGTIRPTFKMDRVLEYNDHAAKSISGDAGFYLRFRAEMDTTDTIFVFYFGGPIDANGLGQYALQMDGDGKAVLWERSGSSWKLRDVWRWTDRWVNPLETYTVRILPHGERFIEFRHGVTDDRPMLAVSSLLSPAQVVTSRGGFSSSSPPHLYRDKVHVGKAGKVPLVTGAGPIRYDWNRSMRIQMQTNILQYDTVATGFVLDAPMDTMPAISAARLFQVQIYGDIYSRYGIDQGAITPDVADGVSGALLASGTEAFVGPDGKTKTVPGFVPIIQQDNTIAVQLTLSSINPDHTPVLWGYNVSRNPGPSTLRAGAVTISGRTQIREVNLMGGNSEPDTESAYLNLVDTRGVLTSLAQHASTPLLVQVAYDRNDATKKVNAFRGYAERSDRKPRGARSGSFRNWVDYDVTCRGMWLRLYERRFGNWPNFEVDPKAPDAPDGSRQPYTFTSIIRQSLWQAGFQSDQLDIPEQEFRPWWNPDKDNWSIMRPLPATSIGEFVVYLCTSFLGQFLIWDANAGTDGMWRLRPFPDGTEPALWSFTSSPPGGRKIVHQSKSYGTKTSPIFRAGYRDYVVPPEGNYLVAIGLKGDNTVSDQVSVTKQRINYKSFDYDATIPTADPTDYDYLGRCVPILHFEPFCTKQPAIDWVSRRIANVAMRGYRIFEWTSEYVFVDPLATPGFVAQTPTNGDTSHTSGSTSFVAIVHPDGLGGVPSYWQTGDTLQFASGQTASIVGIGSLASGNGFVTLDHPVSILPGDKVQNLTRNDPVYNAGKKRPLLFGDLVNVNGMLCMIRSVSPAWRHDTLQLCKYEAQVWRSQMWGKP